MALDYRSFQTNFGGNDVLFFKIQVVLVFELFKPFFEIIVKRHIPSGSRE